VCEEALRPSTSPTSVIIAYHPPLFKPLRSLTLSNPLQTSLLKCIANGISIYSPHSALDAATGGVNDWLAGGCNTDEILGLASTVRISDIGEIKTQSEGKEVGVGRMVHFGRPVDLQAVIRAIKAHLSMDTGRHDCFAFFNKRADPGLVLVELAQSPTGPSSISTIALCAGSGSSVIGQTPADVYFTGEMSHVCSYLSPRIS